jgi:hypothetical protein
MEQQAMRQLAIEVMTGRKPLPMEVKAWPIDSSMAAQQRDTQAELVTNQRELLTQLADILGRLTDRAIGSGAEATTLADRQPHEPGLAPRYFTEGQESTPYSHSLPGTGNGSSQGLVLLCRKNDIL